MDGCSYRQPCLATCVDYPDVLPVEEVLERKRRQCGSVVG